MAVWNSQIVHYINIILFTFFWIQAPNVEIDLHMCTVSEDMLSRGIATWLRSKYMLFSDEYIKEMNGNLPYSRQCRISYQLICVFSFTFYSELVCVKGNEKLQIWHNLLTPVTFQIIVFFLLWNTKGDADCKICSFP